MHRRNPNKGPRFLNQVLTLGFRLEVDWILSEQQARQSLHVAAGEAMGTSFAAGTTDGPSSVDEPLAVIGLV